MSWYDLLMLAVLVTTVLFGMWKGVAWQVASVASLALSYFVASSFWPAVAPLITVEPPLNEFIAMFALFLGTGLLVWIGFGFVRKTIDNWHLKTWDRQAGAIVGGFKGILLCMLITLFAVTLSGDDRKRDIINSHSGRMISNAIQQVEIAVPTNMHEMIEDYLERYYREVERHHDPDNTTPPLDLGEWVSTLQIRSREEAPPENEGFEGGLTTQRPAGEGHNESGVDVGPWTPNAVWEATRDRLPDFDRPR